MSTREGPPCLNPMKARNSEQWSEWTRPREGPKKGKRMGKKRGPTLGGKKELGQFSYRGCLTLLTPGAKRALEKKSQTANEMEE